MINYAYFYKGAEEDNVDFFLLRNKTKKRFISHVLFFVCKKVTLSSPLKRYPDPTP